MTREIKYRIWIRDWAGGRMVNEGFAINENGKVYFKADESDMYILGYRGKQDRVVMQFTSLKDKNGKDIYEGDILNIDNMKVPVEFYNGAFVVRYFSIPTTSYLSVFDSSDIEIIGNIYENPNLLKPL